MLITVILDGEGLALRGDGNVVSGPNYKDLLRVWLRSVESVAEICCECG